MTADDGVCDCLVVVQLPLEPDYTSRFYLRLKIREQLGVSTPPVVDAVVDAINFLVIMLVMGLQ